LKRTVLCLWTVSILATACSSPRHHTADDFDLRNPPPSLGRPGWVRVPAQIGAYAGGIIGLVASIAVLPVTLPLGLLADESLGKTQREFIFFPVYLGAGTGHFVLGAPLDFLHYVGYRAWTLEEPPPGYDYVPMPPPANSHATPAAGSDATSGAGGGETHGSDR
jgi:hypothetical protein